jgi:hypothetical protein
MSPESRDNPVEIIRRLEALLRGRNFPLAEVMGIMNHHGLLEIALQVNDGSRARKALELNQRAVDGWYQFALNARVHGAPSLREDFVRRDDALRASRKALTAVKKVLWRDQVVKKVLWRDRIGAWLSSFRVSKQMTKWSG